MLFMSRVNEIEPPTTTPNNKKIQKIFNKKEMETNIDILWFVYHCRHNNDDHCECKIYGKLKKNDDKMTYNCLLFTIL